MPLGGLGIAGIGSLIGGVGSIFGGLFGASESSKAEKQYLAQLQNAQNSLQGNMEQGLGNYNPYLAGGSQAEGLLSEMLGTPGQGLLTPWTQQFQAPTAAQAAQTPGYQFQLQQGENAMQNSAAAQGGLLSGGTLAGLNNYAQGVASTNYQNTFNNALSQYQSAYQTFLNNQQSTYGMLSGQAGQGLQAAGGAGNLISGIGGDIASLYGAKGAAQAQGTIGQANALSGILPGVSNSLLGYGLLSQMNGTGGLGGGYSTVSPGAGGQYGPGGTPNQFPNGILNLNPGG
jgi:hypothetical protein